jgi:hydroxyacylglutathione hydrolase
LRIAVCYYLDELPAISDRISSMRVAILPSLSDNYIYMTEHDSAAEAAAVDPGEAAPVLDYLRNSGRRLSAILTTHHHHDHIGGIGKLIAGHPGIPVYGGAGDRSKIPSMNGLLNDGDEVDVCGSKARVMHIPGHTQFHIAYHFAASADLFSGDTVFGGTIGNLFGGTPEEMFQTIARIRALPPETRIWCSHEYTLQYVRESAGIDRSNRALAQRLAALEKVAPLREPTVPLTLREECETNPFFRFDDPELTARLGTQAGFPTFARLCELS